MASIAEDFAFWRLRRIGLARTATRLLTNTSARLPVMPPDAVQVNWTGNSGAPLLEQGVVFVDTMIARYASLLGRQLRGATVLDYGCGWGRLMRLMYAEIPPSKLYGCDPWSESIDLCRAHGVRGHLAISDYLPSALPFGDTQFDLIYAYSVFTHLSERTCDTVLSALRKRIKPDGLLCITVRPEAYWSAHPGLPTERAALAECHRVRGFAFTPHKRRRPVDGEITYGDSSTSVEYMRSRWSDWTIAGTAAITDRYQTVVFLRPA